MYVHITIPIVCTQPAQPREVQFQEGHTRYGSDAHDYERLLRLMRAEPERLTELINRVCVCGCC